MFLGYQNDKIAFVADTREELENIPCVSFDKIEEVVFAEMFNGVIYTSEEELMQVKTKAVEETRAGLYAAQVDPLMSEYNRKKTFNLFKEEEEEALLKAIEDKVAEIKENNPYPVEESEVIEDGLQRKEKEIEEPLVELYSMEI